ncbi:hypothetical protein V1289_007238 [Bradyrhizobium sp. AZCC 2289]
MDDDFSARQFGAQDFHHGGQPIHLVAGEEADRKQCPRRSRCSARRLRSCLRLGKRQPCMVEKGPTGGGQFNAVHATYHQLNADLVFEIADLPAQRRLRGAQPFFSRERQAALFGNRDKITKVP